MRLPAAHTIRTFAPACLFLLVVACSGSKAVNRGTIDTNPGTVAVSSPSTSAGASVSGAATPTRTALPNIQLTPLPGAPVVDLGTAHRLEAEGNLADALVAYLSQAPKGSINRLEGVLGAGRVLLALDRPADASAILESFVAEATAADAPPVRYLLGRAYAALKMPDKALAQFDGYVQSGRPATGYAQYDRALALLDLGQPAGAALAAQNGLNSALTDDAKHRFTLLVAQAYERANQPADALRWYQNLFDSSPGDQSVALSKIIAIKRRSGDSTVSADIQKLLGSYAASGEAMSLLNELVANKQNVDPYLQGLVLYRHNDYTKAQPFFKQVVDAAPEAASSAEAYYFLGAIAESQLKDDEAIGNYARTQSLNPNSSLADDALWWRGRLLEADNRLDEAASTLSRLVSQYPTSSWASDGAFQLGMLAYDKKDYKGAAQMWASRVNFVSNQEESNRLSLWQGKALLKAKDSDGAKDVLGPMTVRAEDDYYGVRAAGLLAGLSGPPRATVEKTLDLSPAYDWNAAEAWLAQKTGKPVTTVAAQAWSNNPHWKKAQELWLLGRDSQADAEIYNLIGVNANDAVAMYTLSRALAADSHISMSARAGQRLLRSLNTEPSQGLPKALMGLSYPAPYATDLGKAAAAQKISPLLMLALIRQESYFDPGAISGAGAIGLTQLLPATASTLAAKVDIPSFDPDELTDAGVNLRIGAAYIAQQLKDFEGSIFAAFAAYNAGPNITQTWYRAAKSDADEFVEKVEFSETRLYVRIVAENYAVYRYLYDGEKAPDLPSD